MKELEALLESWRNSSDGTDTKQSSYLEGWADGVNKCIMELEGWAERVGEHMKELEAVMAKMKGEE